MPKTRRLSHEGTLYHDSKRDIWVSEFRWTDSEGKSHKKRMSSMYKSEVVERMDQFVYDLKLDKDNPERFNRNFEEISRYWLDNIMSMKVKPSTFARLECTLRVNVIPYVGKTRIDNITTKDVQDMVIALNEKGLAPSTIKKAYEMVNTVCAYYIDTEMPGLRNPCKGVVIPKREAEEIRIFDKDERKIIEEECYRTYSTGRFVYWNGPGLVFLLYSGLRIGEAIALTWDDIDFKKRTIDVNKNAVTTRNGDKPGEKYALLNQNSTKTKAGTRIVPMTKKAYEALKVLQKRDGKKSKYVFITKFGTQSTPCYFNRAFHQVLYNSGITFKGETYGVHTLRHTFATMLFSNGADVKIVSSILGHSSVRITYDVYIKVIQEEKVKAIKSLDKFVD